MKIKLFLIGFFLCHLDAFSFGGIPVTWIGFFICILYSSSNRLMPFHALTTSFLFMLAVLTLSTILNWRKVIPSDYIAYRMITLIGFFTIVNFISQYSLTSKSSEFLERHVVRIGVIIAYISIFVFLLHATGLGDLPRNRTGTGGFEQAIIFSFEIGGQAHRALGTFREPSFLAMALVLPAIVALKNRQWRDFSLITISLYLTYSFGVVLAIIMGVMFTLIFSMDIRKLPMALLTFGSVLLFSFPILSILLSNSILFQRFNHIASGGLTESSRGYVYENINFIADNWLIGSGIGSFSFRLAELLGIDYPVSVLNLFLSMLANGGALSLASILYWFFYPNFSMRRYRPHFASREVFLLLLPLNMFFFLYLTSFEELHIWHAISLGLILGRIRRIRCYIHQKTLLKRSLKNTICFTTHKYSHSK